MTEHAKTDHAELFTRANKAVTASLGPPPDQVEIPHVLRTSKTLAGRIDHTLLKPDATLAAIETLCDEAREHQFASVCVNTRWVPTAAERLSGCAVMVCTVVGFPLGAMTRLAKAEEARITVAEGADLMAFRIRDAAHAADVPVLEQPPLARALYAHTEVDQQVPAALFAAVAQVLAWVFQLRASLAGQGGAPAAMGAVDVPPDMDPHSATGLPHPARRARIARHAETESS